MKFYRILSDVKWQVANDCSGYAKRSPKSERVMPPIACPVCGNATRDTRNPGFCYPAADLARFPSALCKQLDFGTVIDPETWKTLRRKVVACLPYEVPITPGTWFGPGTLEVHGRFADLYPNLQLGDGRFMVSRTALQRLRESGIQDLFAVPVQVQSRRKAPDQYLELQIEHHARLLGSLDRTEIEADLRKIDADWARQRVLVCDRCGREDGKIPKRIVLVGSTIPEGINLFRLTQRPRTVFCTETFAEAVQKLGLTNVLLEAVRTDGSEKHQGFARVQALRPEVWSSAPIVRAAKPPGGATPRKHKAVRPPKAPAPSSPDRLLKADALRSCSQALRALARPCLRLVLHRARRVPVGANRLGGLPDLPKHLGWPGKAGTQLDFVIQLNCADLERALPGTGLPRSGWLWFFYDAEHCPPGLFSSDKDLWAVRYWDGPVSALAPATAPAWWVQSTAFPRCQVALQPAEWLPDLNDPAVRPLRLKPPQCRAYGDALKRLRGPGDAPVHKLLGWPDTIQNAMEADCRLLAGRGAWRLLLQLDTDANAGMMWGDSGRLYVWIRDEDLKARRFERSWVFLQCY